eukprot:TRINITY_DN767_c0_g1_i3.p2 TRINITY_DN767_c0_g1~~TRINITY_DN767_c0_g1_i3.p2  ORF type:complete len:167 (-),score=43.30 TRINITY_DN767_c0_g1_i3:52-552(-)
MTLDTFSSHETMNATLKQRTLADAERWGVTITRVEIMNILPPRDIKTAMESQIKQERERRSTVLQADGERESAIVRSHGDAAKVVLEAEASKMERVNAAKGEAESKMLLATAEAQCIKSLRAAISDPQVNAADYLVAVQYLSALHAMNPSKATLIPAKIINVIPTL